MNAIFGVIILVAFLATLAGGEAQAVSAAVFTSARGAAELALGLVGYMAFFLGLMKIGEAGGLLRLMARAIRPIMTRLFPEVPPDHPAMGSMILNIASNMLGLGNAATPFGIQAMRQLNTLNPHPGVATNAMVLFLAINTSGLALLPSGVASIRDLEGSAQPWIIMGPTLVATALSTITGVLVAKTLQRRFPARPLEQPPEVEDPPAVLELEGREASASGAALFAFFLALGMGALAVPALGMALVSSQDPLHGQLQAFSSQAGQWVIPVLVTSLVVFGWARGVAIYERFVEGAREGFEVAVRIIPYLVAILVAVGMFRASGAMLFLTQGLGDWTSAIGLPGEVLPMALVRPLSGSGAMGIMTELIQTHGPDSYIGTVASVLNGSTETTFYVLAVYFGAAGVVRVRHAIFAGLAADFVGAVSAGLLCRALFA